VLQLLSESHEGSCVNKMRNISSYAFSGFEQGFGQSVLIKYV